MAHFSTALLTARLIHFSTALYMLSTQTKLTLLWKPADKYPTMILLSPLPAAWDSGYFIVVPV